MNKLLSSTTWGEVPMPRRELNAADWMSGSYYDTSNWEENYNNARIHEAVGRERRKQRISAYHKKSIRNGVVGLVTVVVMLAVVGTIIGS